MIKKEEVDQDKKLIESKVDLDKILKASGERIEKLRAGRHVDDIPLDDEYWIELNRHQLAHNK